MLNVRSIRMLGLLPVLAGFTAACSDIGPTRPSRAPLRPGSAAPARIELMAPDAVPPGRSAPLTLMAYFDDGSTRDVTVEAAYASSNTGVLDFPTPGRVSAIAAGEATIAVTYIGLHIARLMFAMPSGTFRLTGTVTDAQVGVDRAEVRVLSGAGAGLSAVTSATGQYRLYGVAGDTLVEVRKDRYETRAQVIDVAENSLLNFVLSPDA